MLPMPPRHGGASRYVVSCQQPLHLMRKLRVNCHLSSLVGLTARPRAQPAKESFCTAAGQLILHDSTSSGRNSRNSPFYQVMATPATVSDTSSGAINQQGATVV